MPNEILNASIPLTIGALTFAAGVVIERIRRKGDMKFMRDELEYTEQEIENQQRRPSTTFNQLVVHAIPFGIGCVASAFLAQREPLHSAAVAAGTHFTLFTLKVLIESITHRSF